MKIFLRENLESEPYYINRKKNPSVIKFATTGNTYWEPLYDWLKTFFGEKYNIAANQWMHMAYVKPWEEFNGWMYEYKHGMTRKSLLLDEYGTPYTISWLTEHGQIVIIDGNRIKKAIIKDTYKNSFKRVYEDIEKFVRRENDENPCFVSYNDEYRRKMVAALEAAGYMVCAIDVNNMDDFKKAID